MRRGCTVLELIAEPGFLRRVQDLGASFEAGFAGLLFEVCRRGLTMALKFDHERGGVLAAKRLIDGGVFAVYAEHVPSSTVKANRLPSAFAQFCRDTGTRITFFVNGVNRSWTVNAPASTAEQTGDAPVVNLVTPPTAGRHHVVKPSWFCEVLMRCGSRPCSRSGPCSAMSSAVGGRPVRRAAAGQARTA